MKLNKKVALYGIAIVFFGLMSIGFSNKAKAGLPGFDPLVDIVIGGLIFDYNSCWLNLVWNCPGDPQAPPGLNCSLSENYCSSYSDEQSVNVGPQYTIGETGQWWCDHHFGRNLGGSWDCVSVSGCSCGSSVPPNATVTCRRCCTPNCNDSTSYCKGDSYEGNCGQTCIGTNDWASDCQTCTPNCNNSTSYCKGDSYEGNCGQSCEGTNDWASDCQTCTPNCDDSGDHCPGDYTGNCEQTCQGTGYCPPGCDPNCGDTSQRCPTETWSNGCIDNACRGTKDCSDGACSTPDHTWTICSTPTLLCSSGTPSSIYGTGIPDWWWFCSGGSGTASCWANLNFCGDGKIACGEQCDDGAGNGAWPSACSTSCTTNVCPANCNDSDSTCKGKSYTGNCGQTCPGTMDPRYGLPSPCTKSCGGGTSTKIGICTPDVTVTCNTQPCPPGYREVTPW